MKFENITSLIQYVRNNVLSQKYNDLTISIYSKEVDFSLYESGDITIVCKEELLYDSQLQKSEKKWLAKLNTECYNGDITTDELREIATVAEILEDNMDIVKELVK